MLSGLTVLLRTPSIKAQNTDFIVVHQIIVRPIFHLMQYTDISQLGDSMNSISFTMLIIFNMSLTEKLNHNHYSLPVVDNYYHVFHPNSS